MVSHKMYEFCRPVLEDEKLADEEKTDRLEELLSGEPFSLKDKALEDAVLGALWKWKEAGDKDSSPPATRGATVIRSRSPAPWLQQRSATPSSLSGSPRPANAAPAAPPGLGPQAPAFARTKSSTASPFTSPRPSPRLAFASPAIPHSPRLSAYQFSDASPSTENYGDYGSENVDWLVNDDTSSNASFGEAGYSSSEFMTPYTSDMTPFDMIRSILQEDRTDEELDQILEANGYDLSQTINALMEAQGMGANVMAAALQQQQQESQNRFHLIGKNMSPSSRPVTPAGQQRSPIVCRYWLTSGHCARADCRFAHEVKNHVCKYWLQGNCIAGSACLFSHDPATLMNNLNMNGSGVNTPQQFTPNFQLQDYDSFPALQPTTSNPYEDTSTFDPHTLNSVLQQQQVEAIQQSQPSFFPNFVPTGPRYGNSRPNSRPGSRHASRTGTPSQQPNFQDDDSFPTLTASAGVKSGKRHHGKRGGHGHHNQNPNASNNNHQLQPSNLADVVRNSPSPAPSSKSAEAMRRGLRANRSFTSSRENSSTAMGIPAPQEVPWLETGDNANRAYLKARAEAFKHGGLRNKFLQSAAQAWNRNDARGAKALSLRGQSENGAMREAHREAARALYEERNKHQAGGASKELYVDLHGLHPEEAVSYLTSCLAEQKGATRPVYAICGTGHHSKNGKDKVGKAVRQFLNEWRYAFREFSVPGDRNNVGGILGIDAQSYDKEAAKKSSDSGVDLDGAARDGSTKVMLVKEDPRRASSRAIEQSTEDEDAES